LFRLRAGRPGGPARAPIGDRRSAFRTGRIGSGGGVASLIPSLAQFRRVVLKVGSALLVDRARGRLNHGWLAALAEDIAGLHGRGVDVLVVSSGAIALGRTVLSLPAGSLRLRGSPRAGGR